MINCDSCDEWFHGKCVNVTKVQGTHCYKTYLSIYLFFVPFFITIRKENGKVETRMVLSKLFGRI